MFNYINLCMHSAIWIDCNFYGKEDWLELTLELCANSFNALPEKALRHEDLQGAPLLILANKQVRSAVLSFHLKKSLKSWYEIPNKVMAIFSILLKLRNNSVDHVGIENFCACLLLGEYLIRIDFFWVGLVYFNIVNHFLKIKNKKFMNNLLILFSCIRTSLIFWTVKSYPPLCLMNFGPGWNSCFHSIVLYMEKEETLDKHFISWDFKRVLYIALSFFLELNGVSLFSLLSCHLCFKWQSQLWNDSEVEPTIITKSHGESREEKERIKKLKGGERRS